MRRAFLTTSTIACFLLFGAPTGSTALAADAQNPISSIGKATKDAGKAATKGTKEAVKKAGDVSEDAAEKTVKETKNAGKTVQAAATPDMTSVRCKDGTVQTVSSGKTKADACRKHRGLKP